MFNNKLIQLGLVTLIVIIAASIFVNLRAPQSGKGKVAYFPDLTDQLEKINQISIQSYAEEIHLTRHAQGWGIDEFDGYPALSDKVKSVVLSVADFKLNAAKTALPRLYHRLGVEGLDIEDSTSLLLSFKDSEKNNLINVIIGKPRRSSTSQNIPGLYIREPDQAQSFLVDGKLDITAIKTDWIERSLFDVPAETIKSVRIDHADGDTFTLFKSEQGQEKFELEGLPLGKKLASEILINRFGTLLQDMQISGARTQSIFEPDDDAIRARITTFEGIVANVVVITTEDIPYASFEFSYDEGLLVAGEKEKIADVKAFAEVLNARTGNWWFEIPAFKYDIMKKRSGFIMQDDNAAFSDESE